MKRVFAFIGFSFAITLLFVNIIPFPAVRYIALVLSILTALSLIIKDIRQAKVVTVILCSSTIACLLFLFVYSSVTAPQLALDNTEAQASIQVTSVGKERDSGGYTYTARINQLNGNNCNIKVRLNTEKQLDADPYDNISAYVKLYSISDDAYSSYGYYADNIYLSAKLKGNYSVIKNECKPLHYHIIILTQQIKAEIYNYFDGDVGALAVSILTGDTSNLSADIYSDFKICGVTHTVAVSGLHTTLICLSVYMVLKLLRCPKAMSTVLTILILFAYIAVTDFSKSAMRAGIMLCVLLLSKLLSSKADGLNSLGLAVFILCLNPYTVYDAGAVLSVCAVLGIMTIYPHIRKQDDDEPKFKKYFLNSVSLTISVTLSMLPAMCMYFESISFVGILINFIIIPLLELALISVCLMLVFCKSAILAFIPQHIADLALSAMIRITDIFADAFHWMSLSSKDNYLLIASAFCLIFIGVMLIINKTVSVKITGAVLSVLIVFSSAFCAYDNYTTVCVSCLESGGVIISSRDTIAAVNIDDYSDYYPLLNENENKQLALISCDSYSENLKSRFTSAVDFGNSGSGVYQLDDKITIDLSDNTVQVTIFDNCFKINENDVIINDIMLSNKALSSLNKDLLLYFRNGREVKYRYG